MWKENSYILGNNLMSFISPVNYVHGIFMT